MYGNECGVSVTSHKKKQPEGSSRPVIQQVAPLSGKQQSLGSICSQEVPVWPSVVVHSLSAPQVPPGSVVVMQPQSSQIWGWLSISALKAVPALKTKCWTAGCSASQHCLPFSHVSSFAFQQLAFQCSWYSDTITEMPALGSAGAWDLLLGVVSTCVSLCQLVLQQPQVFPSWTGLCYMLEHKVCMLYFLHGMVVKIFCPHLLVLFKQFSIP